LRVIRPVGRWTSLGLRDVLSYRELLGFLLWRDVKVRYQQTLLGVLWVVLQPLSYALVFSFLFGRVIGVPTGSVPYPVFCFTGLLLWGLFSAGLTAASPSIISHSELVQKVYFPRLLLPLSAVLGGLVDLAVNSAVLALLMVYYGIGIGPNLLFAPLFVLGTIAAAVGLGSLLAALNVPYRDVRHITPPLTQLWLIATPVAYPLSLFPEKWRGIMALNPMAGMTEGFRWAVLGSPRPDLSLLAASLTTAAAMLVAGLIIFRRLEARFADVI
jgi:lipopolysaccharide transport system permease protein